MLPLQAYPPAPHHLFFGVVRDEYGSPLVAEETEIILTTSAGTQIKSKLIPGLSAGVNYELSVAMDAGLSSDLYKPTALRPNVPFKIRVRIGTQVFLPIEMSGDFSQMGRAGKRTKLDLTLGEDSDGDGLTDAWERMMNSDLSQVNPNEDSDQDGLSNYDEYIAGTYAFDPEDGFTLAIVRAEGSSALGFLAISGRTYQLLGSSDFSAWEPVAFRLAGEGEEVPARSSYFARDVRKILAQPAGSAELKFFKLLVN